MLRIVPLEGGREGTQAQVCAVSKACAPGAADWPSSCSAQVTVLLGMASLSTAWVPWGALELAWWTYFSTEPRESIEY